MYESVKNQTFNIWMQVLLLEALKANRCDYVRVLLDQGVKLKMINLPELYEQVSYLISVNFLMIFFKFSFFKMTFFTTQTVSCQKCKFKRKDCLHMQWILKVIYKCMRYNIIKDIEIFKMLSFF